jgi:DNA-binding MltR family transcriptional regulator
MDLKVTDYQELVETYHAESDRAAAVLAGSFLEEFLGQFLRQFLAKEPEVEPLFGHYGPLGTFAARIDLAFAMGLIYREVWQDLHYIRKVRNHFAHHPLDTSFESSPVRDWCACLSTARVASAKDATEHRVVKPRLQYLFAVSKSVAIAHNTELTGKRWF